MASLHTPGGVFPGGEAASQYRGQCANKQRTMALTEAFPAITFVNSRHIEVVSSPDEI